MSFLQLGDVVVLLAELAFQVLGALLEEGLLGQREAAGLEGAQLEQVGIHGRDFGHQRVVAQAQGLQLRALALEIGLQGLVLLDLLLELAVLGFDFGGEGLVLLAFLLVEVEQDAVDAEQDEHQGHPEEDAAVVGAGFGGFVRVHAGMVKRERSGKRSGKICRMCGAGRHVPLA